MKDLGYVHFVMPKNMTLNTGIKKIMLLSQANIFEERNENFAFGNHHAMIVARFFFGWMSPGGRDRY